LDLPQLELLGKVAGIGGIAIGAVVIIIRGIVDKTSSLPARQRAAMLRLLAIGAFGFGVLGIMAWVAGGWSGGQTASTRGNDSPAIIDGEDRRRPVARDRLRWRRHRLDANGFDNAQAAMTEEGLQCSMSESCANRSDLPSLRPCC
jgi:hypothetical protein